MDDSHYRIYARSLSWLLATAVAGYSLIVLTANLRAWTDPEVLARFALLAGPAAVAAWLGSRHTTRAPRLGAAFVVAGLVLLPSPGALLVALVAGGAGRGGGIAGSYGRNVAGFAAAAVGVTVAQYFAAALLWSDATDSAILVRLALLFVLVQGFAFLLALPLDPEARDTWLAPDGPGWRTLLAEVVVVPMAWLLVVLYGLGSILPVAMVSALLLLACAGLVRLDVALRDARLANDALEDRRAELGTLHAVGQGILSSMDRSRLFALLDRECRKIFDIDHCYVALVDEDRDLTVAYRHRRGQKPDHTEAPVADALASAVAHDGHGRRLDDVRVLPPESVRQRDLVDPQTRSALLVPLVVEGSVIGVLGLQSFSPEAYDDHQLSLLGTIAQQAAVAIENVRNFQMASIDSLTGFFARDYFFRRLDEEHSRVRRYGGRFALLMVDIDTFKEINDRHGHLAGDQFLEEIAATVRTQLRAADIACRYGGDEFCLLLPETDLGGARSIAERIRTAVSRRIVGADGMALRTTVSIGLAVFPEHGSRDARELLRNADDALYRAKAKGRNCVVPYAA